MGLAKFAVLVFAIKEYFTAGKNDLILDSVETGIKKKFYDKAYWYFLLAALVTIIGFFPSYFSRLTVTDPAHHLHGITATCWMLLLVVQPWLYKTGKLSLHRNLGKSSYVLVPLILLSGLNMVHIMLNNQVNYPPDLPYRLAFIDFITLAQFLLFYGLAINHRKKLQLHARYMACTVLGPLIPALTRALFLIPWIDHFDKALNTSYILIESVLVILLLDDRRTGRIRLPYVLALILFFVQHLVMNFVGQWTWWRSLMDAYAGLRF